MGSTERKPDEYTIKIKVRLELEASLWATLASSAVALVLTVYDLLSWLIK